MSDRYLDFTQSAFGKSLSGLLGLPTPPRRSVVFALWDSEEDGLVGSLYYVAHPITAGGGENVAYETHVYNRPSRFDDAGDVGMHTAHPATFAHDPTNGGGRRTKTPGLRCRCSAGALWFRVKGSIPPHQRRHHDEPELQRVGQCLW